MRHGRLVAPEPCADTVRWRAGFSSVPSWPPSPPPDFSCMGVLLWSKPPCCGCPSRMFLILSARLWGAVRKPAWVAILDTPHGRASPGGWDWLWLSRVLPGMGPWGTPGCAGTGEVSALPLTQDCPECPRGFLQVRRLGSSSGLAPCPGTRAVFETCLVVALSGAGLLWAAFPRKTSGTVVDR